MFVHFSTQKVYRLGSEGVNNPVTDVIHKVKWCDQDVQHCQAAQLSHCYLLNNPVTDVNRKVKWYVRTMK